jgi:hypothetical protein
MKTKILILSIVLMTILSVGIACAATEEINGIEFKLPDGYESTSNFEISGNDFGHGIGDFSNGVDEVHITVDDLNPGDNLKDLAKDVSKDVKKTKIGNITGYSEKTDDDKVRFIYTEGDKIV